MVGLVSCVAHKMIFELIPAVEHTAADLKEEVEEKTVGQSRKGKESNLRGELRKPNRYTGRLQKTVHSTRHYIFESNDLSVSPKPYFIY